MGFRILFALLLMSITVKSQELKRPKLIIGIVVDQMRYDYLDKFWEDFEEGGFKKLVNKGFLCKNIKYSYKPTYTGPGHASIFSGTTPSIHGIVGNNWYSREKGKVVYCVKEETEKGVILYSPNRMLVENLADQVKQFTNFQGKSFAISLKDRGAILPAGQLANGAYWFNSNLGEWESSVYYESKEPDWLKEFNQIDLGKKYLQNGWQLSKAKEDYTESQPDKNSFERPFFKDGGTVFPYDLIEIKEKVGWGVLKGIPQGNQMTIDLGIQLLKKEQLGRDEDLDFLSISFSATDYVGHRFGVQSMEVHDTYIKLDKSIAELITTLETEVGQDNFVLFLTSDHGAGMPRSYLNENSIPNGYLDAKMIEESLESRLDSVYGDQEWISSFINLNIYFGEHFNSFDVNQQQTILKECKLLLEQFDGIKQVLSKTEINNQTSELARMSLNGYHPDNSGDIILVEEPNWNNYSSEGSTHGSPYPYDTHVPAIFYGFGIKSGSSLKKHEIIDIAPTISIICNIGLPQQSTGEVIKEMIK